MRLAGVGPARKSTTRIVFARRLMRRQSDTTSFWKKTSSTDFC